MTNAVIGTLAQNNTNYNLVQAAKEVTYDILSNNDLLNFFKGYGAINTSADEIVGDTVNFYNLNRVDSNGFSESADVYANAADSVYGQRQLLMDAVVYAHKVVRKNTMTQIRADTSVGDLTKGVREILTQWGKEDLNASFINQVCGNTATSIIRQQLSATAFSGSTLLNVTGLNAVSAVNADYVFYANNNAGSPANPSAITTSNYLTLLDFMNVEATIFNQYEEQSQWMGFDAGKGCRAIAVVTRTNWQQMMTQAPASNAYPNVAFERYQAIAAGASEKSRYTGKMVGNFRLYESIFTPDIMYLVVDDAVLPRATHSSAAVANTRVIPIIGKNAVDMKVGSMLPGIGNATPAFSIDYDDQHERLNNFVYYKLGMKYGIKRTRIEGFGSKAGTFYDAGVATILAYSAN